MGLYATKLMELVNQIASPLVSTSTTTGTNTTKGTTTSTGTGTGTTKANEGLDLSSLMMLLALSGMFNKPTTSTLGTTPTTAGVDTSALQKYAPSTMGSSGLDLGSLLRILSSIRT